jgi:MFS family permease
MPRPPLPKRFSAFLATQALGAFNDNLVKMLLQLYVLQVLAQTEAEAIISRGTLLFTIPYVLFGPWSGFLSDKYSKTLVMRVIKFFEIGILSLAVYAFYLGHINFLLGILFLMATHSTFSLPPNPASFLRSARTSRSPGPTAGSK